MSRVLAIVCLMLASCEFAYGEPETETSDVDQIREWIRCYDQAPDDEKITMLSEAQLTEEDVNHRRFWTGVEWKYEGTYQLPKSHSMLSIPSGYAALFDDDALHAYSFLNVIVDDSVEAFVESEDDDIILFRNHEVGYVANDDWKDVDPERLLREIIKNTEEDNQERRRKGKSEIHVIGWIQKPTFDQPTQTVYWATEGESSDDGHSINAVAIRLGRKGYEMITWITSRSSYIPFEGHLSAMLNAHRFDPGYRYSDYTVGDRIAEYSIASLVAAIAGGAVFKSTGLFVLLKKFAGLILAAGAATFYRLRRWFKGENG